MSLCVTGQGCLSVTLVSRRSGRAKGASPADMGPKGRKPMSLLRGSIPPSSLRGGNVRDRLSSASHGSSPWPMEIRMAVALRPGPAGGVQKSWSSIWPVLLGMEDWKRRGLWQLGGRCAEVLVNSLGPRALLWSCVSCRREAEAVRARTVGSNEFIFWS